MKKQRSKKGETLVETIVSFAVVLLTLTMVTAIVQISIRLNGRAMKKALALETATAAVEAGTMGSPQTGSVSFRLVLPGNNTVLVPIDVYTGELLSYFETAEGTP